MTTPGLALALASVQGIPEVLASVLHRDEVAQRLSVLANDAQRERAWRARSRRQSVRLVVRLGRELRRADREGSPLGVLAALAGLLRAGVALEELRELAELVEDLRGLRRDDGR